MYAIIRAGGHQEKVSVGAQIVVDRLSGEIGDEITFVPLMVSSDDGAVVSDRHELESKASVVGRVLQHIKGDKVDVFQYRQKTGYRRHVGHRQPLTLVEIAEIRFGESVARIGDTASEPDQSPAEEPESVTAPDPEAATPTKPKPKAAKPKAVKPKAAAKPKAARSKAAAKPAKGRADA